MNNRHIWSGMVAIIIGSLLTGCAQQVRPTLTSLTFIDPNFKRCVFAQGKKNIDQITTLKCSHFNIRDAREVRYLTHLTTLDLSSNQLTFVDISHNPKLQVLSVEHNKLAHLNISHNRQLKIVNVSFNRLKTLDVSHNPLLTYLNYGATLIKHVDIRHNPHLIAPFQMINVPNGPTITEK